ncbi:disks large-associated protein 5 isoform X8 [Dendroctonus ponderosae]|uniref:disks large-associated protein 5 isoform X8 n=1 Tax=Dendroctonus ponderosae TaxID=77166 RepID=UPI00203548EE|nr:disks large-associated protein 5 isoform X8 [Dendroctonus ponderosae]
MDRLEYMRMLLQNKRPNLGANLKQKIEDRKEAFALDRKTKKDLRDIGRRNIDVNMSPYITPASKNVKLPVIKPSLNNDTVNKRLEMLAKWKADKAKAKEQSTRSKPIFKVSTVVSDPSTKLENANRFIKGKLIVSTTQKSKFAPDNYKFKAPSTVKNLVTTLGDKTGSKSGTVPKKQPVETKQPAKSNSVKKVDCKTESTTTLRRSDRIRCKMGMITNPNGAEGKPTSSGKTEENPIKNPKKGLRGKILKVVEEEETAAALKAEENKSVLDTTFTMNTEGGAASNITALSGIAELHDISEVDYSTTPRRRSIMLKSIDKKKRTPYRNNFKSSTPVSAEEVLNDITFDLQEQNTPERRSPRKSKGVRKSNGNAISARKEPKKTLDAIGNLSNDQKINPPVYISPFVTISRGKKNARDEHIIRRSLGRDLSMKNTDIDVASIINGHTSPDAAADYFMAKLNASIQNINELCEKWGKCLQDPALSEEASSSIVGTIGQSKLLISDKFEQFRKLIIQCKNQDSAEGYIRCEDLHGFWDMIYLQVEKLEKTFDHLHCLKENNWIELLPEKKVVKKCPKVRGTKPVAQSRIKDLIKAAREKRNKMENNVVEECKRVEVKTPKREPQVPQAEPQSSSKRRSSRVSLLAENSRHSSPGLIVMKLMQSIKYGDGLTPARSILKHQNLKSTGKKSVTFRPSLTTGTLTPTALFRAEEKENTPRMVRRSRRTSQAIS